MGKGKFSILAILGFVLSFFAPYIGIILCLIALVRISRHGQKGKYLAIAGIIISTLIMLAVILIYSTLFFAIIDSISKM
jgi:hypothetical protein